MPNKPDIQPDIPDEGINHEARLLARRGWGWEDIRAFLRDDGCTRLIARVAVFGKLQARRMEERDTAGQVPWRLPTTTAKATKAGMS